MQNREEVEQTTLMRWAQFAQGAYPDLEWLYHCPNGGHRSKATAGRMKAAGVKAGVPDLHLAVKHGKYGALWIEMKAGKNKPTEEQRKWLLHAHADGDAVAVCWSFEEAREVIIAYLNDEEIPLPACLKKGVGENV